MLGFVIGFAAGIGQFFLLSRFVSMVTSGTFSINAAVFGILQFIIPLIVLLLCVFVARQDLTWAAMGIAAALIGGAVIKFIRSGRPGKESDNGDD